MALASGAELWGEMTDANPHNLFLMKNWLEGDYTNVIAISVINIMKIRTVRPSEDMQLHPCFDSSMNMQTSPIALQRYSRHSAIRNDLMPLHFWSPGQLQFWAGASPMLARAQECHHPHTR